MIKNNAIYLDNAATTWPKPLCMIDAMARFYSETGANPGRAGHRLANEAAGIVYGARERVARLFNCQDALRVVFGSNVTEALNLALFGLLRPGDHVITTGMEHNSMMRPLRALERDGIRLTVVRSSRTGETDPRDIQKAVGRDTRLVAVNHVSNVNGTVAPIREIGLIARENNLLFLVDTAQSAGILDIDMEADNIDCAAFTGHKSLYGPMGTGGLVIGERVDVSKIRPIKRGGTGSRSASEEQPDFLPDALESGTLNVAGLAGLSASLEWLEGTGIETARRHERALAKQCIERLSLIDGVTIHGFGDVRRQTAVISITVEGHDMAEAAHDLDRNHGVMCRAGLHCAPAAHRAIGTFPDGTLRFSIGFFNTVADIDMAVTAVEAIVRNARQR